MLKVSLQRLSEARVSTALLHAPLRVSIVINPISREEDFIVDGDQMLLVDGREFNVTKQPK